MAAILILTKPCIIYVIYAISWSNFRMLTMRSNNSNYGKKSDKYNLNKQVYNDLALLYEYSAKVIVYINTELSAIRLIITIS